MVGWRKICNFCHCDDSTIQKESGDLEYKRSASKRLLRSGDQKVLIRLYLMEIHMLWIGEETFWICNELDHFKCSWTNGPWGAISSGPILIWWLAVHTIPFEGRLLWKSGRLLVWSDLVGGEVARLYHGFLVTGLIPTVPSEWSDSTGR